MDSIQFYNKTGKIREVDLIKLGFKQRYNHFYILDIFINKREYRKSIFKKAKFVKIGQFDTSFIIKENGEKIFINGFSSHFDSSYFFGKHKFNIDTYNKIINEYENKINGIIKEMNKLDIIINKIKEEKLTEKEIIYKHTHKSRRNNIWSFLTD